MQNIESLFKQVHTPLKIKELIPINQENIEKINRLTGSMFKIETIDKVFAEMGLEIKNLFYSPVGFYPYWYVEGFSFIGTMALESNWLKIIKENTSKHNKSLQELWENKNFAQFFTIINASFAFDVFLNRIDDIPKANIYPIFKSLYINNDYGFQDIEKNMVHKILSLNNDKSFIQKIHIPQNGFVSIYRGECSESSNYKNAYSWTLNYDTALYFATRFNSLESKIYKAKVHVSNIVDFIEDRGEQEILVLPEMLLKVTDLNLYNFNERFMNKLQNSRGIDYIEQYKFYQTNYIQKYLFQNPNGVHGVLHAKRVLLLSLIISFLEKLDEVDMNILCLSACYHDIGRIHDSKDEYHGELSVAKIDDFGILEDIGSELELNNQDINIVQAIIKNHAIDDDKGVVDILSDTNVFNKDRAIKLYRLFKDADNLDRVRLNHDLDMKYLRGKFSKKLVLVAYQLLKNIQ